MSSSEISQSSTLFPLLSASGPHKEDGREYPRVVTFSDGETLPLFSGGIVTSAELEALVADCAADILSNYSGRKILIIQVLEGARPFCSKVLEHLAAAKDIEYRLAEVKVSSYSDGTRAGDHKVVLPLQTTSGEQLGDLSGFDVTLVLDDLIDAGGTFLWLVEKYLPEFRAQDIRACFMLEKKRARQAAVQEAIVRCMPLIGKVVPDEWVVGFGLDIALPGGPGRDDLHLFRNELPGGIYAFNAAIEQKLISEYQTNPEQLIEQLGIYVNEI